jgi:hypothetical protein
MDSIKRIHMCDFNAETGQFISQQISAVMDFNDNFSVMGPASKLSVAAGWDYFIFGTASFITIQNQSFTFSK